MNIFWGSFSVDFYIPYRYSGHIARDFRNTWLVMINTDIEMETAQLKKKAQSTACSHSRQTRDRPCVNFVFLFNTITPWPLVHVIFRHDQS